MFSNNGKMRRVFFLVYIRYVNQFLCKRSYHFSQLVNSWHVDNKPMTSLDPTSQCCIDFFYLQTLLIVTMKFCCLFYVCKKHHVGSLCSDYDGARSLGLKIPLWAWQSWSLHFLDIYSILDMVHLSFSQWCVYCRALRCMW